MKFWILLSIFTFFSLDSKSEASPSLKAVGINAIQSDGIKERRGEFKPPISIYDLEEMNKVLFSEMSEQKSELKKVKYYLLNGEVRLAKMYLFKISRTQNKLRPVIFRYLGILSFVDGDFKKTYEYLSIPELQKIPHFSKICIVKTLTGIVLNKINQLQKDWTECKEQNSYQFQGNRDLWIETIVQLKIKPFVGTTKIPFKNLNIAAFDAEEAKLMLKLALYLNQEQLIIDQMNEFSFDQLQDEEFRELLGQALFRVGKFAKAYRFIEDLKTPNVENIKGNLYSLRNKYELAYAQHKLALDQKQNSQNALERLLPLAWLLGDWEGGSKYAENVITSPQTQINKYTIMAAFLMQKGEYNQSNQILGKISSDSKKGTEIEVSQIAGFNSMMLNKANLAKKHAYQSCYQFDLISCWLLFQLTQWDQFPSTIKREETLPHKREWENLVNEDRNQPLQEKNYINQLDIEELDDKLIQLMPSSEGN